MYAIIGDVHSQYDKLARALEYCNKNNLQPILLGDIFDSRCDVSDSVGVYNLVRTYPKLVLLQSNHQDKLLRLCKHAKQAQESNIGTIYHLNKIKFNISPDLWRTINDFSGSGITMNDIIEFLEPLPYVVAIDGFYRLAHAYCPYLIDKTYNTGLTMIHKEELTKTERYLCLYGKKTREGERVRWWENTPNRGWVRVAGHYHVHHDSVLNIVADGSCGDEGGVLLLYNVEKMEWEVFE